MSNTSPKEDPDAADLAALRQAYGEAVSGPAPWLRLPLEADEKGQIWMNDGDALVDDRGHSEPEAADFVVAAVNYVAALLADPESEEK